jgi:hypothetical protein
MNWLMLHEKVAAALVMAVVLIAAAPQLKSYGIDLTTQWQLVLTVLAAWATPGSNGVAKA